MTPHLVFQAKDDGGSARVAAVEMERSIFWRCERRKELRMTPRFGAQETKLTSLQTHPYLLSRQKSLLLFSRPQNQPEKNNMFTVSKYVSFFFFHEREILVCRLVRKEEGVP